MAGHSRNKDFVGKAESPDACALLCVTVRTKKQEKIFANYDFDTKECHCLTQVVGVVRKAKTTVCELIDASEGNFLIKCSQVNIYASHLSCFNKYLAFKHLKEN